MKYRPTAYHGLYFGPKTQPPVPTVGQPPYLGQFMAQEVSMTPYDRGQFAPVYLTRKKKWHPVYVPKEKWHPVYLPKKAPSPYACGPVGQYGQASEGREVKGKGGFDYKQEPSGKITIIAAPADKQSSLGKSYTSGSVWQAITNEIGAYPQTQATKKKGQSWQELIAGTAKSYFSAITPQMPLEETTTVVVEEEKKFPWAPVLVGGTLLISMIFMGVVAVRRSK